VALAPVLPHVFSNIKCFVIYHEYTHREFFDHFHTFDIISELCTKFYLRKIEDRQKGIDVIAKIGTNDPSMDPVFLPQKSQSSQ